jgi:hypothetical protein
MTRQKLEMLRDGVEAQKRWALVHGGDQELVDLLRDETKRLSVMIKLSAPMIGAPRRPPAADAG